MNYNEMFDEINYVLEKIKDGSYKNYLEQVENELLEFISKYDIKSFFSLLNYCIYTHDINMRYLYYRKDKYDNSIHISLKLAISLQTFYYYNVLKIGKKKVYDYERESRLLINILRRIEFIYLYYPHRNNNSYGKNPDLEKYYQNYFRSYFFDYETFTMFDYSNFFINNINLCKNVLNDNNFEENLCIINRIVLFYHKEQKNTNISFMSNCLNKYKWSVNGITLLSKVNILKKQFKRNTDKYNEFISTYFYDIRKRTCNKKLSLLECIQTIDNKIGFIFDKYIFIPRYYFILDKLYIKIWRSNEILKNTSDGKTIKSSNHETDIKKILERAFGKDNVYSQCYLKKRNGQFSEKDFIVLYNDYILSFEAKSKLLPIPNENFEEGMNILKKVYSESIVKAIEQSKELKSAIKSKNAHIYKNNKKPYKKILDLSKCDYKKFLSIVVVYESFINIQTNPYYLFGEEKIKQMWIADVKSLEKILEQTVLNNKGDMFIKFVKYRIRSYNCVNIQKGEEIKAFELFYKMPMFFEKDVGKMGITIDM